jgi:hypothetical protein
LAYERIVDLELERELDLDLELDLGPTSKRGRPDKYLIKAAIALVC